MKVIFITEKLNSKKYLEMIDEQINTYPTRIITVHATKVV